MNLTTIKHHVIRGIEMLDLYSYLVPNAVKMYILECLGFFKLVLGL